MGHERKCSSSGTGLSRGITLPYVKYLLLTTYFVMRTTYLEGLLDEKRKIKAVQSDLEAIKWALIKTIISG